MNRCGLLVLLGVVLSASSTTDAQAPPDSATLVGSWIGGMVVGGDTQSVSLRIRLLQPLAGRWRLPLMGDSAEIQSGSLVGNRLRATLAGPASLDVRVLAGRMRGAVIFRRRRGTVELAHLAAAAPTAESLGLYVGDYDAGEGRMLVIGRSLGQLYYMDPETGRQGPMFALSPTAFVAGPAHGLSYPMTELTFERDSMGRATRVRWRRPAGPVRLAERVVRYDEREVTFTNGPIALSGSVLLPRTPGPHPGVVLVHGSNAQSRNGQNSIYRFHADDFARRGIAVLIYDKRGIGGSKGHWDDPGLEGDALAALRLLRRQPGVDPMRVGLWGLSQGAWLVGQAAAKAPREVAFIVMVGGGALNPQVQEIERTELQMRADGFPESEIRDALELQRLKFRYARRRVGWDEYLAAVERARGKAWLEDPYIGPPTTQDSPAWDFWARGVGGGAASPEEYLPRVRCPVLALVGELDTYGSVPETLTLLDLYLQRGGNDRVTLRRVPGASHSMHSARTGGPRELPTLGGFVPGYLAMVGEWILAQSGVR